MQVGRAGLRGPPPDTLQGRDHVQGGEEPALGCLVGTFKVEEQRDCTWAAVVLRRPVAEVEHWFPTLADERALVSVSSGEMGFTATQHSGIFRVESLLPSPVRSTPAGEQAGRGAARLAGRAPRSPRHPPPRARPLSGSTSAPPRGDLREASRARSRGQGVGWGWACAWSRPHPRRTQVPRPRARRRGSGRAGRGCAGRQLRSRFPSRTLGVPPAPRRPLESGRGVFNGV